jgi:Zn-dependent metalloprotease
MEEQRVQNRALSDRLQVRIAACVGAAALAIGMALTAMTAVIMLLGALGVGSAPDTLDAAVQDAAVVLYVVQLVGVSFFNHTAELRFVAVPGLLLVGLSVIAATAVMVRALPGSARRKMTVAPAVAVPYALLMGFAGLFVPLHFTASGLGVGIAVSPSPAEAFLLPLCWGLLFASVGGLIGVFGRGWRHAAWRLLDAWAVPLASLLRVLAGSLAASTAVLLIGGLAIVGGDLGSVAGGSLAGAIKVLVAAVVAVPTLVASVLVSGFGVPFDWQLDTLSHADGSISAFGGALPSAGGDPSQSQSAPGVLALAPLIVLAAVLALGWISARRSGFDARLGLANVLRAATLMTLAIWLLALLTRVDAQVGGLLGFHLAADVGALLWRVPLVTFLGCFAGGLAYVLTRAPVRRRPAALLVAAFHPSNKRWGLNGSGRPDRAAQGLTWRAALGLGFASLPVMLVGAGATGTATSAGPPKVSLAPISRAAEQRLERAATKDESVSVTVDPETRELGTASVHTPLRALGIAAGESRQAKAKIVLERYGDLFGLSDPATELGNAQVTIDEFGVTHVSFTQMAEGLPVFAGGIGVHLSRKGELLSFLAGSVIPDLSVADDEAKLSSKQAIEVAKGALPSGSLAQPARLQVYAGLPPYTSGPNARLAWFVWLISENRHQSDEFVVDAVTGEILDTIPKAEHVLDRKVYDAEEKAVLPGKLVRVEKDPETKDVDADDAFDHTGDVHNFYEKRLTLDSYNGKGATLISSVHVAEPSGAPLENAYWNGQQMAFGDGFPAALDVVGHELTHAYVQFTSGLVGTGQSGALNESLSDIMGVAVEAEKTEEVDWEVGEDLPEGVGPIRDLAEPGIHGDPEALWEWVESCLDNFGVHTNSTITSHAFFFAVSNLSAALEMTAEEAAVVAALVFYQGFTEYLKGNPTATLEDARAATLQAAKEYLGEELVIVFEEAFEAVGLDGFAQPPKIDCSGELDCSFALALNSRQNLSGDDAAALLSTLYKARGALAFGSAAGDHFLPLYEEHMGRISELVSQDPELSEMAVSGLEEVTPGLEALAEGDGEQLGLTSTQMAKIETALERLAEDDRLYGGPGAGELADLIEDELEWMGLSSYGGMDYESGFERLNEEVEAHGLMEETGVIVDPNCTGLQNGGYPNTFHINGFYVDTPGHRIPGQTSPLNAGAIICGAEVEATGGQSGCVGEKSLNTTVSVQLPPGDKVNSTKNLTNHSWVGEAIGRAIICAGDETRILYGQGSLLSLSSWSSSQCPESALACYEGRTLFEGGEFPVVAEGYGWVTKGGTFTTRPVEMTLENGYEVQASFGQLEVKLCARAGGVESGKCGGPTAPWLHQNGEAGEAGCPEGKGRFTAWANNAAKEETLTASSCVLWEKGAQMQTVGAPNSLNAVSCVPETTTCVAADSNGNAFYAEKASPSSPATWSSWSGPGVSPGHAVECPSKTLCLLAAGEVSGGGGNLYRATALGGSFLTSFKPPNGVGAISCPSTSFCVTTLEGGGFIRYSTNPSGILWSSVSIGSGAMKDVSCLSASFCAVVDAAGNVRVATTEKGVKEAGGWTATNVSKVALGAIACSSTSSCVALDGSDEVLNLAIEGGKATVKKQALAGAGELTEVTCNGADCVAVDDEGGVFASDNSGAGWTKRFATTGNATSVSCASPELCVSVDTSGDVVMFDPK